MPSVRSRALLVLVVALIALLSCSLPVPLAALVPSPTPLPTSTPTQTLTPTSTRTPTPTVTATATPTAIIPAQLAGAIIFANDLPAEYEKVSKEELARRGMSEESMAKAFGEAFLNAQPTAFWAFTSPSNKETIVGMILYPLTPLEQTNVDLSLSDPESFARDLAASTKASSFGWVTDHSAKVGDAFAEAILDLQTPDGIAIEESVFVARSDAALIMVFNVLPHGGVRLSLGWLAGIIDERIQTLLPTVPPAAATGSNLG